MKSKKAFSFPVLESILVLLSISIILIGFIIIINESRNFAFDEKKIKTQIAISKLVNGDCIGDEFAIINEKIYSNQDILKECFQGSDERLLIRTSISDLKAESLLPDSTRYNLDSSLFAQKRNLCTFKSENLLCTQKQIPITFENDKGERSPQLLIIQIIAQT
ncbi:hypothetical protein EOM09_07985 [bacterium]|nr:hypothetical protein [bacterium]